MWRFEPIRKVAHQLNRLYFGPMELSQHVTLHTHEEVADMIRQQIRAGEAAVGIRLPPQRELSNMLGVSRQSIREALLTLEDEGLIETRRGATGGSFVTAPQLSRRGILRWVRTNLIDLDDICDFRIAVEGQSAALAAQRRTTDDLSCMREAIDALPIKGATREDFREADGKFHAAVARSARNSRLEQAVRKARSDLFIPTDEIDFTQEVETTRRQHTEIYSAIANKDTDKAVSLMVFHIENTRSHIRMLLSGNLQFRGPSV